MRHKPLRMALWVALCAALAGCVEHDMYRVEGKSELLDNGDTVVLYLTTDPLSGHPADTAVVSEGTFVFEGTADSLCLAMVACPSKPEAYMLFVLENGNIRLKLSDMPMQCRASGTANNRRWQRFMRSTMPVGLAIDSIARDMSKGYMDYNQQMHAMAHIDSLGRVFGDIVSETANKHADNSFGRLIRQYFDTHIHQQ